MFLDEINALGHCSNCCTISKAAYKCQSTMTSSQKYLIFSQKFIKFFQTEICRHLSKMSTDYNRFSQCDLEVLCLSVRVSQLRKRYRWYLLCYVIGHRLSMPKGRWNNVGRGGISSAWLARVLKFRWKFIEISVKRGLWWSSNFV